MKDMLYHLSQRAIDSSGSHRILSCLYYAYIPSRGEKKIGPENMCVCFALTTFVFQASAVFP